MLRKQSHELSRKIILQENAHAKTLVSLQAKLLIFSHLILTKLGPAIKTLSGQKLSPNRFQLLLKTFSSQCTVLGALRFGDTQKIYTIKITDQTSERNPKFAGVQIIPIQAKARQFKFARDLRKLWIQIKIRKKEDFSTSSNLFSKNS